MYEIITNQKGVHPNLIATCRKYAEETYQRPIQPMSIEILAQYQSMVDANLRPVIWDLGCGLGRSTVALAEKYPEHLIVGVDKSTWRLERARKRLHPADAERIVYLTLDVCDLWQYTIQKNQRIDAMYWLYPNPWPRKQNLKRRWYMFPDMKRLLTHIDYIECRTNWPVYADEMCQVLSYYGRVAKTQIIKPESSMTHFEAKYQQNDVTLYQVTA